jgi:putative endonuclease
VYIVRCADDTLYTGIAIDVMRRVQEHNEGRKGAKYTRARRPVELVYTEQVENRSMAAKREHQIKQLPLSEKQRLMQSTA